VNRNKPISQVEVEEEIIRLVSMLEDETENFERLIQDMANKEANYKSAWAKEYLSAKGSIKEREAWADYRLEKETFDWKIAEALVKGKREKLSSLRTSVDALRTLAANVRSQTN
jgi:hypothetical protein